MDKNGNGLAWAGLIVFVVVLVIVFIMNNVISVEDDYDNTKMITDFSTIFKIRKILDKYDYDSKLCLHNIDYQLTIGNRVYFIKKECNTIELGSKQTEVEKEDMEELLSLIGGM